MSVAVDAPKKSQRKSSRRYRKQTPSKTYETPDKQNDMTTSGGSECDESGTGEMRPDGVFVLVVKEKSETPVITKRERSGRTFPLVNSWDNLWTQAWTEVGQGQERPKDLPRKSL